MAQAARVNMLTFPQGARVTLTAGVYRIRQRVLPGQVTNPETDLNSGFATIQAGDGDAAARRVAVVGVGSNNTVILRDPLFPDTIAGVYRLFTVVNGGSLELSNLAVENGNADKGGAVRFETGNAGRLTISGCRFADNKATGIGGAVFAKQSGLTGGTTTGVSIINTVFERNVAQDGQGGGLFAENVNLEVLGATRFSCNQAVGSLGDGGGLYYNRGKSTAVLNFAMGPDPSAIGNVETLPRPLFTCNSADRDGGGVWIFNITNEPASGSTEPQRPIRFDAYGNSAGQAGGGLYLKGSVQNFIGCKIGSDVVRNGAGLPEPCQCCKGVQPNTCVPVPGVDQCPGGNAATRGGGTFVETSDARFLRCIFKRNFATTSGPTLGDGGGAYGRSSPVKFEECCFSENYAQRGGGGAFMAVSSLPYWDDCVFTDNRAAFGGGIGLSDRADGFIYNCVLTQNIGETEGGGIWSQDSSPSILHTTIARNLARCRDASCTPLAGTPPATAGTGIHVTSTFAGAAQEIMPTVINSIIWGNEHGTATNNGSFSFRGSFVIPANFAAAPSPRLAFSDVQRPGGPGNAFPDRFSGTATSNINCDPKFFSLGLCDRNIHLKPCSPAIDRANWQLARTTISQLLTNQPLLFPREMRDIAADPLALSTFLDTYENDYDDKATGCLDFCYPDGSFLTDCIDELCYSASDPRDGNSLAAVAQCRTNRRNQCQSDMGADESATFDQIDPIGQKVVCELPPGTTPPISQFFETTVRCPDPTDVVEAGCLSYVIRWCKVIPRTDGSGLCDEIEILNNTRPAGPSGGLFTITTVGNTSRLTVTGPTRLDSGVYKAKARRAGVVDPAPGCDVAVLGRLYVVPGPTATTADKTVCRHGNQCLEYAFSWTVLPAVVPAIPGCGIPEFVPPTSCTPAISYSYQRTVGGPISTFTGNARATITCSPDTTAADPAFPGATRVTRNCRICFIDALDGTTSASECDAGRYCGKISCGLVTDKCRDAEACANLCVIPTPIPGGDQKNVVCTTGNQTINLNGTFPLPSACALPWCPTNPCTPVVSISRLRSAPGSLEEQLFTYPNAQNVSTVTIGNTVVTCTPLNTTTRRINCTVTVNNAVTADCARYRITTDCANLVPDDKCRAAFWDSVLCVLPPINGVGDPIKNVCLGGTQTACLYLEYPAPDCIYCLPPYFETATPPCTPTFPPVVRRVLPNGTTVTIALAALGDGTGRFRGSRTDAPPVAGQATSTTTVTCEPFNAATRRINCCVEVRNANDTNCARYRIEGNCSNLPATDKCQGAAETSICVARPPTVTAAPDQFVCLDGDQTFPLSANFPTQPCIHCGPLTPRVMVLFRPTGGAEQMFPCVAQPNGTCIGTIGNASIVCDPFNASTRNINCTVTVNDARYAECGEYCIKADYVGVDADKCPPVIGCTRVCIVPKPIASGDPDKFVCFGKSQQLNFKATFPRGLCLVTTGCPTACTPAASMFKRDAAGVVTPLTTGGGTTVTCQPVATLPNGDREINCTVNVTNADSADCLEYILRASCANLNANKCQTVEWATKLCVIRNPVVTIDPQRYVCVGGNQTIGATVNFPAQDCFYCPTNACTGTFEFVRRPNTSCTSPSTGGAVLPIVPTGQTPPATGPYVTCTPSPDGRTQNCTIFIRNAVDAGSAGADCGAYYVRAKACPNLPTDKCDYVEACGQLCVVPAPDASGDSNKCVCIGGNQVFNFRGFFPTPSCVACPTSPAACTPFVTLVRKLPGGGEQVLYVSSGTQPGPQPRITATCTPLAGVTGGREFRCTVTINAAEAADCAEYCLRASCSNLDTGKCATDEWCANLCVLPNPRTGGDTSKTVCVKGTQYVDLYAEFPEGDCGYCTLPGANCCTPAWTIKRRSPSGTEITLNIGGSRTDSQTYPSLPGPPDGAETVVATTSVACEPIGPGPSRRVNCRVTITNANDANCGEYCIEANCSNYPATGAGSDKCRTSRYCARLCVLRPPSVTAPAEVCVCVGGCQTIPFTVNFPAPNCNVTGCDAATCQRVINVYKLDPNGNRICALSAGAGVDQYVCDPPVNGVQNCRIRVGGGNCGTPGAGCPGAALTEDNNQYCVEVTCGDLAEGKCLTDRSCTRMRVYEPPCPTPIDDIKICQRNEVCVDFNFVAPPCCQSAITITKDGNPIAMSGRYRLITLPAGGRRFCISAPSGQLLDNTDDGVYRITISCPNLTAEKNCSCYEEFCLDILPPPAVTVLPTVQTVCEGQDADFYICPTGDLMYCPVPGGPPGPIPVPLNVVVEKVSARPTGNSCELPQGETATPVWTNVTIAADPTTACPTRYRVHIEDVVDENCGFYRVRVTYAIPGSGFDPEQRCVTCTYFELRCGTVNVCLKITPVCEDEPIKICPRFAACEPDPYQIPGGVNCADYPCFDFKWYFTPSNPPGPEVELIGQTSCCLMFPAAGPEHEGCYRLVVTPNNTRPGCESQPPCDPVEVRDCFYLRPPEECCWCVDCCWDNGRRDNGPNADGVLSMKPAHGEFPEIKAAADFYLCEGQFHRVKKFAGAMLIRQNTTLPYKAKLTLYEDCDGCPGEMIGMWDLVEYCLVETPDSTGLQKIDFVREFTEDDKLWLRGGKTYWWSLQGISDAVTFNYEAYWVTSQLGSIVGGVPKKMEAGVDADWIPLGDCCIDCTELAYCIECEACKIIYDGGIPEPCATAGGSRSEKSVSPTRNSRAADNFVTPPFIKKPDPNRPECEFMSVDWMVCYVEAYIYTNCNPQTFRSYLEIYGNNCDDPSWVLVGEPPYRFRADKIDPVVPECLATIDGVSNLRLYKVRFCPMGSPLYPMGLYLRGGRNYWASVSVEDGFSQNQRAYFAWNSDDCDPCPIQFGPGKEISPGARNIVRWTDVGHDFAFLIAAKNVPFDLTVPNVPATDGGDNCLPDTNGDGNVTVQDLFDFLNSWFAGCP